MLNDGESTHEIIHQQDNDTGGNPVITKPLETMFGKERDERTDSEECNDKCYDVADGEDADLIAGEATAVKNRISGASCRLLRPWLERQGRKRILLLRSYSIFEIVRR